MWGAPEEPPDEMEGPGPSEPHALNTPVGVKEICEDNKSQLETFKDIMLKNKSDLKKKEEELQEYASKLSEIKSRAKRTRRGKDAASSSTETTPRSKGESGLPEVDEDVVDDISQAKTPKAKSSLLQRKLAENRKIFERRSKEMTESKRAVEEKVEAIRQQMDQTDLTMVEAQKDPLTVTPVRPVLVTPQLISPPILYVGQDKDNKIAELSNRILELEASLIDLQDNLREKDSVIDSKTKAVTLMSADLSKKGKTTLDTLEDTKDEMRTMQQNFVLLETSLRGKNDNLLEQLHERNDRVAELEETISRYEQEMEEKRAAETASANFSRSTMDTLADTKDAMRSMQENFVLIETSLKDKIENLLGQLEDRETKLAEAVEKIYKLESGAGIVSPPEIPDLQYKIDRLEQSNRALQDEKYELQKSIAVLQEKIVARESSNGNGLIIEKDNRIAELENLIEELKSSNQLLEEESKAELQKQVADLATKNEEFGTKIDELERLNNDLEIERNELRARLPDESGATKEDTMVRKLTKELDDLNKSMIKLKAQHKGKLRNLQKQLESFKMVSDANAELVKLGNQVALLEEEKGNLQLSLVDFDELKASAGDWQDRIADLESRVSTQTNDIQSHIEAIAILENQKLDLMQELHTAKQEISALEAENAESENLRVTAEMKVVDLEEQLESSHRSRDAIESSQPLAESEREELLRRIDHLTSENSELTQKLLKLDEKPSSEAGSTESFETIHEDRNEMLKKIEALSSRNNELEEKLSKLEEAARSNVGSTESFETINDTDRIELVKKIDSLSRENSDLVAKLNKYEEKGSSDTGSTESFEKIPERSENSSRIEFLTRENNELVIKLTKLEEKIENLDVRQVSSDEHPSSEESSELDRKLQSLVSENNDLVIELTKAQEKLSRVTEEKVVLEKRLEDSRNASELETARQEELRSRLEVLTSENNDLVIKLVKLEEKNLELIESIRKSSESEADCKRIFQESEVQSGTVVTVASLEREIEECRKLIAEQSDLIDEMKTKLSEKESELATRIERINEYEASSVSVEELQRELKESFGVVDEWKFKCTEMERKMEILEAGKVSIEEGLRLLQEDNRALVEQSRQKDEAASALKQELDGTITTFENQLEAERALIAKQDQEINSLREILKSKDEELHDKYSTLQNEMIKIDSLQEELNASRTELRQSEATIVSLNEEIRRLSDFAENSREEIAVLREELLTKAAKEARNEELSRALSDKETLVDELRATLNEQLEENAEMRNSTEKLSAEVAKLRASLAERESEVASIAEAKSLVEENLRESELARAEAEVRLESLQSNFDENSRYTDGLRAELSDAYRMLELLKAKHTEDIEMQNRRLEDLIEELNGKSSELETLRSELSSKASMIEELDRLRAELSEKENSIRELEARTSEFDKLRAEREKLVGQNVTEQAKIALEQRVSELELKLEESSASTQAQLQKRKILAANLKKKSSEAAELEAKVVQLELRLAELESRLAESETRISHLEPKCLEAEARASSLEEKWTLEKSEKESANLRIQEIESIVENRDTAILQLESQLQRSRDEAASATSRVDALTSELETSSEKMNILTDQVAEMGEEIERLRSALDFSSTELQGLELERDKLLAEGESAMLRIAQEETQRQQVLEAEARASSLEEKFIHEKTEKESANLRIQEMETLVENRDSAILQLESQLQRSRDEAASATSRVDALTSELETSSEHLAVMGAEIARLRSELDLSSTELQGLKLDRERLIAEGESGRLRITQEETQRQQVLEEAKEKARELGVRMQVMEAEYVEQLNTIQTLRTENGMLLSKQAQISERLENSEKEAADQRVLLEQFERESESRATGGLLQGEAPDAVEDVPEVEGKASSQPCDQCGQCETVVQALEAKLQERDAEIENLDNELANSIGNFVHMRESLRVNDLMNQSAGRNRSLEESRENSELVFQYNSLTASNAEIRDQLNATIQENSELREKIASLQALNAALQERIGAVEAELVEGREASTRLQAIDALRSELVERCESRERELSGLRGELEVTRQRHEELRVENVDLTRRSDELVEKRSLAEIEIGALRTEVEESALRIRELENEVEEHKLENARLVGQSSRPGEAAIFVEKRNLAEVDESALRIRELENEVEEHKLENARLVAQSSRPVEPASFDEARNLAEIEIGSLRKEVEESALRIRELENEVEEHKLENARLVAQSSRALEPASFVEKKDEAPRLFDAARLFGSPTSSSEERKELDALRKTLADKDREILRLSGDIRGATESLEIAEAHRRRLEDELTLLGQTVNERNLRIDSLSAELNNVGARLTAQFDQQRGIDEELESRNEKIKLDDAEASVENLKSANSELAEDVEKFRDAEVSVESLKAANSKLAEDLERLRVENLRLFETLDLVSSATRNLADFDPNGLSEVSLDSALPSFLSVKRAEIFDALLALRDERNDLASRMSILEREVENSSDASRVQELEERVDAILRERDIKQLQVNDLTRSLEEMQESMERSSSNEEVRLRNLQAALDRALSEHDSLKARLESSTSEGVVDNAETQSAQPQGQRRELEASALEAEDDEPRLEVDEEIWSWNPEDSESNVAATPLIPNVEIALKARIAELEDTIRDLELEREKLTEEAKNSQLRSGKLLKKLKEFKIQNESLQQQLKIQRASGGFCDLDSAIEEELKSQISRLERSLSESRDEQRKIVAERESSSKRIEVLTAANERLVEMKERQDMEVEVLRIRAGDLASKLEALERRFRETCGEEVRAATVEARGAETLQAPPGAASGTESLCDKYREEIDELRDEMEALAAENEQLQKLLEEQRSTRLSTEARLSSELEERAKQVESSRLRIEELERNLRDSRENCQSLANECEQLARTSAEQEALRRSHEALKLEVAEKTSLFQEEVGRMSEQISSAARQTSALQERLRVLVGEKEELAERARSQEESGEKLSAMTEAMAEVTDLLNARVQEVAELRREIQKLKADRNEALETAEGLAQNRSELGEKRLEAELHVRQCEAQLLESSSTLKELEGRLSEAEEERAVSLVSVRNLREEVERLNGALAESGAHRESLQSELASKEQELFGHEDQARNRSAEVERLNELVLHLQRSSAEAVVEANRKLREVEEREANLKRTISELNFRESEALAQMYREIAEKDGQVAALQQTVANLEQKIREVTNGRWKDKNLEVEKVEELPVFRMADEDPELRKTIDALRAELARKEQEIEEREANLKRTISERNSRESEALAQMDREIAEKDGQVAALRQTVVNLEQKIREVTNGLGRDKNLEVAKAEELPVFRMADEDSELRNTVDALRAELARKEQEIEQREATLNVRESEALAQLYREIAEKDGQVAALRQTVANLEQKIREVGEDPELRNTVDALRAELARKAEEIEDYRYQLSESTYPSIIQALQDQVNTLYEEKAQLEESLAAATESLAVERRRRDELEELLRQQSQLQSELESQVDELAGIVEGGENKDLEIRRLGAEGEEREARLGELRGRCGKVEAEVDAMRNELASKDEEIAVLRGKLDSASEECELLRRVSKTAVQSDEVEELRRSVASAAASTKSDEAKMEQSSNELDLALYMLHQRDVRCEELTHELMQLLEERDTLQLRLSNAIRVNEELRSSLPAEAHPSAESLQGIAQPEPLVEQPSPSRSVGPVEIAKEAIDSPSEEKVALAEKLSQLHNMGHRRDVRLMDDRDMRHNQQMSLLAHRDVLSTLPPEAAARIVNANYTLSRDVQSQSSVLMNWLWGKSTPKVVHM